MDITMDIILFVGIVVGGVIAITETIHSILLYRSYSKKIQDKEKSDANNETA